MNLNLVRERFRPAYDELSRSYRGLPRPELTKADERTHTEIASWWDPRGRRGLQLYLGGGDARDLPHFWFKSVGKGLIPPADQRRLLVVNAPAPVRDIRQILTLATMWIVEDCAEIVAISFLMRWPKQPK